MRSAQPASLRLSAFSGSPICDHFKSWVTDHRFVEGAGFRDLSDLYSFDGRLRFLVMDAIEKVEVGARAMISIHMGPKYGTRWYLDAHLFRARADARLACTRRADNGCVISLVSRFVEGRRQKSYCQTNGSSLTTGAVVASHSDDSSEHLCPSCQALEP